MKQQKTNKQQTQRGQSLVEVALFFPIFVILLAGLVEVSQLLVTQNKVSSAARASTRFLSNGGEDAGASTVLLNTITQTLQTEGGVWDAWSIRATVNSDGTLISDEDWEFTHVYGVSNTVRSSSVNEREIKSQIEDELQRNEFVIPTEGIARNLQIVGTYAIHDVDSILGLDAMSQLAGFSSLNALSIMRITADGLVVTNGCSAFPIGVYEGSRSVTAPGTGSDPYPDAGDFRYPSNPPVYESFVNHDDNIPLLEAQEGDVFRIWDGSGSGQFGWLVWNGSINNSATTLQDSLTWPGNSTDYTDHGDGGNPIPINGWNGGGENYTPRGYIEPGDVTDQALHIGDQIQGSGGTMNSGPGRAILEEHIELDRHIRVIVWNTSNGEGGSNALYDVSGFAIFRIIGHNLPQGWMLAEFIRWDDSCGQLN